MKCSVLILCALVYSFNAFNQTIFAEFTTDTSRINDHMRERISKELWYINGQEMRYDGKTIKIKVNPDKFDTIVYYRQNQKITLGQFRLVLFLRVQSPQAMLPYCLQTTLGQSHFQNPRIGFGKTPLMRQALHL